MVFSNLKNTLNIQFAKTQSPIFMMLRGLYVLSKDFENTGRTLVFIFLKYCLLCTSYQFVLDLNVNNIKNVVSAMLMHQ